MRIISAASFAFAVALAAVPLGTVSQAQEAVTPANDVESLFTDPDPKLHANKQAAYHIMKDLLEAGHWDQSGRYMTERYIQHNPNVASVRQAVVDFFKGLGAQPKRIPERLSAPVVQVVAQGDYVAVVTVSTLPTPSDPSRTYTTSWFDMWRFIDGKADEHWDSATLMR